MTAKKSVSPRSWKSDLARVDAHAVQPSEYEELPELNDEMLSRGKLMKAGRPISINPRQLVSIRLPADVLARWKASGRGWQTRMARVIERARVTAR